MVIDNRDVSAFPSYLRRRLAACDEAILPCKARPERFVAKRTDVVSPNLRRPNSRKERGGRAEKGTNEHEWAEDWRHNGGQKDRRLARVCVGGYSNLPKFGTIYSGRHTLFGNAEHGVRLHVLTCVADGVRRVDIGMQGASREVCRQTRRRPSRKALSQASRRYSADITKVA